MLQFDLGESRADGRLPGYGTLICQQCCAQERGLRALFVWKSSDYSLPQPSRLSLGLDELILRVKRRGVLLLISDFLVDSLEPLVGSLRKFRSRGWEVIALPHLECSLPQAAYCNKGRGHRRPSTADFSVFSA